MRNFPDITVAEPNMAIWLWVLIPAVLAVLFLLAENVIERITDKSFGKPVVGVGYILMGISIFVALLSFSFIPSILEDEANRNAVQALEEIGFEEIRISTDVGTFGAIYDGELMRGVIIPDVGHPGEYHVQQTFPLD